MKATMNKDIRILFGISAVLMAAPVAAHRGDPPSTRAKPTHYLLFRGDHYRFGQFDPNGNFIPEALLPPYKVAPYFPPNFIPPGLSQPLESHLASAVGANVPTYEHRSGRLIPGTATPKGFVPDINSKVLDLKGFDLRHPEHEQRGIWNGLLSLMDEDAAKALLELWQKQYPGGRPASPPKPPEPSPPKAGIPDGCEFRLYREYMKSEPWFARVIGDVMELGHLNDQGDFVPDYGLPVFPYVDVKEPNVLRDGSGRTIYYTLPGGGTQDLWKNKDSEEVYEYRSGRLIKGTLQKTGNFVPELGSKVLDFKDYNPNERRRIYNLPGVLRKIE